MCLKNKAGLQTTKFNCILTNAIHVFLNPTASLFGVIEVITRCKKKHNSNAQHRAVRAAMAQCSLAAEDGGAYPRCRSPIRSVRPTMPVTRDEKLPG